MALLISSELTSNPPSELSIPEWNIDRAGDVDWTLVQVYNARVGGPDVTVRVTSPPGEAYEVAAWYSCGSPPTCTAGTFDGSEGSGGCVGIGTVSFAASCDRGGVLSVRVRAPTWNGSCEAYTLHIDVR